MALTWWTLLVGANGKIASFVTYDSWGKPTGASALAWGNRELDLVTRFTGYRYDSILDMYYARFRMYDASIRRFTATDPIRGTIMNAQTMAQYTYVLNNPNRFIDPWGLYGLSWIGDGILGGNLWCGMEGTEVWTVIDVNPPSPPSRDSILEEVWDWIEGMTDDELLFAIGSGLFEAMGVHIPSDWLEGLGSDGHVTMNDIRQDLVERLVDTIIEDSSGLGLDLLSGWEYRPGNSWHHSDDADAVWGVNFSQVPTENISWWQYTIGEFRELAIPRDMFDAYMQYIAVARRHGVANPDSDMIGFSDWLVPTYTTATRAFGDRGFGGMLYWAGRWHMGSDFYGVNWTGCSGCS